MSNMNIEKVILAALYEAWSVSDDGCDLRTVRDAQGWDKNTLEKVIARMEHENLIEPRGVITHEITSRGIIYAEDNKIAPEEMTQKNKNARTLLVEALAGVYDKEGPLADSHYTILGRSQSLDDDTAMKNLHVLHRLGYLEESAIGCYKLSYTGLDAFESYKKRRAFAEEFERIAEMEPQPRGRAIQKLLAKLLETQGWSQLEGLRTSNEEFDVIVYRGREYYFIECKWEKDPIQAEVVEKLIGKLIKRTDVKGIIVSKSGFSKGVVDSVKSHANTRMVLLFGPEDLNSMIYGQATFEELLDEKYREFVTRHKVVFL